MRKEVKIWGCLMVGLLVATTAQARTQVNLDLGINAGPLVMAPAPQPVMVAPGQMYAAAPPPPVAAVMVPPQGYNSCYTAPGGWMGNVWVPPHQECEYPNSAGMQMWVSGYWGCLAVGPHGGCGRWKWYGHRWVRGGEVAYYGRHGGRYHHHRNVW